MTGGIPARRDIRRDIGGSRCPRQALPSRQSVVNPKPEAPVATLAATTTSAAPPSSPAPTLSTDRLTPASSTPPPPAGASSWPDEAYKGWASL